MFRLPFKSLVIAAGSALALAACATSTPYQPATGQGFARQGYSDQQIEPNRFVVSFAGNSVTSRDTVDRYLLFRAAQLTLEHGYDYFILVDRDTERKTRTYVNQPFGPGPWGYWSPSWRFHGGFGYRYWDPFYGSPFYNDIDINTIDKYEATAEIVLGKGPKRAGNVRAFDARAVSSNVGPTIEFPKS